MFAKLYGPDDDQTLVLIGAGDEGPQVRFFFRPKGMGVCYVGCNYPDTNEGWEKAEKFFVGLDEEKALAFIAEAKATAGMLQEEMAAPE